MNHDTTEQRIGILVDVQNMFYSAKTLHQSKIDYRKLLEEIVKERKLIRAIAYVVQKPEVDQSSFLEALARCGYEVKHKELPLREDGTSRGDWNIQMALDALVMAPKLDCVALVTGNGNFLPLVGMLSARGCRVEIFSFAQSTSNELIRACDQFVPIERNLLFREERFVQQESQQHGAPPLHPPDEWPRPENLAFDE